MAAWYCQRPTHIVNHTVCDPHHPILGLLSLRDEVESAAEPRECDDKQRAVHATARRNKMIGACLALKRARDMLSTTKGSGGDMEAAEYPKERDSIEDSAEMLLALRYDNPLHLEPCPEDDNPPMPTLLCFQHFGSGDAREIFSQAKDKLPAWSSAAITLTGESMVIGSAESGSDQEQGIDIICRHENIPVSYTHLTLPTNREV